MRHAYDWSMAPKKDRSVTIRIHESTRKTLRALLGIGVTYDSVIANLAAFRQEHMGDPRSGEERR